MNSKKSLPVIAFLAVLAALILAPVSAMVAGLAVSVAGIFLILAADYGRNMTPLRAVSTVVPFAAPRRPAESYREAA
ncbi:MAG TPA: hypothetical protein VGF85_02535 [Opitutaceae bacterium]|jgi:hypothetical protein